MGMVNRYSLHSSVTPYWRALCVTVHVGQLGFLIPHNRILSAHASAISKGKACHSERLKRICDYDPMLQESADFVPSETEAVEWTLLLETCGRSCFRSLSLAATTRFRNRTRWWLSHTKFWLDNGSEEMIHYLNLLEEDFWRGDVITGSDTWMGWNRPSTLSTLWVSALISAISVKIELFRPTLFKSSSSHLWDALERRSCRIIFRREAEERFCWEDSTSLLTEL